MEPIPFKGISMQPLLKDGDLVIIEKISAKISLGDVLLFKDSLNGEFVVHRVIQERPLITKGDWAILSEAPKGEEVFARVIGFRREGRSYSFSKGFLLGLYLFFSKKLLSPVRIFRQISRVALIMTAPLLFTKD